MTKDEALRLALEHGSFPQGSGVIHAIKEALAQPEHGWTSERIAGMSRLKEAQDKRQEFPKRFDTHPTPPQRTWIGLTDEEKADLFAGTAPYYNEADYADAIEAKLKEKNNG